MRKWMKNFISIDQEGNAGTCPICKSNNTDYYYVEVNATRGGGFVEVWCNDCNAQDFMSVRGKFPENRKVRKNKSGEQEYNITMVSTHSLAHN